MKRREKWFKVSDFSLCEGEKSMGICVKCSRKVQHFIKTDAENVETWKSLLESRKMVLSDTRAQTVKRVLQSPGQAFKWKEPIITKIQVVMKWNLSPSAL